VERKGLGSPPFFGWIEVFYALRHKDNSMVAKIADDRLEKHTAATTTMIPLVPEIAPT